MSPKRKRLLITPSDEVWALIDAMHKLTKQPKAALVSEILDEISPAFATQLEALRVLADRPQEALKLMQDASSEKVAELAQANLDLEAALDPRTVKGRRAKSGGRHARAAP